MRQAERSEFTRGAILEAARQLFADRGFGGATVDDIARAAGVAKGAVYHHFTTKEDLFEAVFEQVSAQLVTEVVRSGAGARDALDAMVVGTRAYFEICSGPPYRQIILIDGPAVLGWQRWREIDAAHFGRMIPAALAAAMEQGLLAPQPVEPLARLLLGAASEAAAACASSADPRAVGMAHAAAFQALLDGLRLPPPPS
jgi:AcrR family transcriptional regulator